jgi:FixJ family two-component response regulator
MVSGLAPEFFDEALRDGVIDGFLEKPVGLAELLGAAEAAMRAAGGSPRAE